MRTQSLIVAESGAEYILQVASIIIFGLEKYCQTIKEANVINYNYNGIN